MAVSDLETARDGLEAELATISANPKRSYSVGGRSWSHSEYRTSLIQQVEALTQQILVRNGAVEIKTIALG